MRLSPTPWLLVCVMAASSGCFISENTDIARPCAQDADCPATHRCVTSSSTERTCEILYPPAPLDFDAGPPPDAGPVPTWCKDIQPVMAASCVSSCHGETTTGSGQTGFRLDVYSSTTPKGAREMAGRIQVRAVEQQNMPPSNNPAPTAAQRELIGRWVAGGTPLCDDAGTP
jgi:hypothetical protein